MYFVKIYIKKICFYCVMLNLKFQTKRQTFNQSQSIINEFQQSIMIKLINRYNNEQALNR